MPLLLHTDRLPEYEGAPNLQPQHLAITSKAIIGVEQVNRRVQQKGGPTGQNLWFSACKVGVDPVVARAQRVGVRAIHRDRGRLVHEEFQHGRAPRVLSVELIRTRLALVTDS